MGMSDKLYCRFKDKELYGPNTINGHYQPRDREPVQCFRKASANPCHSGWTTHSAKPRIGMIAKGGKWPRAERLEWQTRQGWTWQQSSPNKWSSRKGWQKRKQCFQRAKSIGYRAGSQRIAHGTGNATMKEKMDMMMNALKGRVSTNLDKLVQWTDSPYTALVTSFPLPAKFRMPQVEAYDGSQDPLDHLESFKTLMHLQGVPDEIMCQAFLTTLKGPIRVGFSKLTPNIVSTFKELSEHFLTHFIEGQRHRRSPVAILSITQWEDESLRSYVTHFNKEALLIDKADVNVLVTAFTHGL